MQTTDAWKDSARLLLETELTPIQGSRFQPTGFADLGAAIYVRPNNDNGKTSTQMLLVESAQSMANRLESTCLEGDGPDIDPELDGLPYLRVKLTGANGDIITSSLVEPHRIAAPFFLGNKDFKGRIAAEMKYDQRRPLDWAAIYRTIFKYDPNCLIHGVFLSLLDGGRVRCPRALSAFIEAEDVEEAHSGGVKNSPVDPKGELRLVEPAFPQTEKGVYSNVPYQRVEFTARKIKAFFNLDLALIRGYRLGEAAERLLVNLALLKIRRFLDGHLRLRTACDFRQAGPLIATPKDFESADEATLLAEVKKGIEQCTAAGLFARPPVTEFESRVKLVTQKDDAEA